MTLRETCVDLSRKEKNISCPEYIGSVGSSGRVEEERGGRKGNGEKYIAKLKNNK